MGRTEASEKQLLAVAQARNYVPGVHRTEDIITAGSKDYNKKTIKDQNTALRLYEKWVMPESFYQPGDTNLAI